ncbi:MAG: hypothetical protein VXW93_03575, partial [Pseudomonadota bacterium]|nr:hypothetical protein [Pseudomonadota bacterium]
RARARIAHSGFLMTIETQISASVKASAWATLSRVTERFFIRLEKQSINNKPRFSIRIRSAQ